MLGLRLDEPVAVGGDEAASVLDSVVDARAVARLADGGLVERVDGGIRLTARGRLLGDAVTADLLA